MGLIDFGVKLKSTKASTTSDAPSEKEATPDKPGSSKKLFSGFGSGRFGSNKTKSVKIDPPDISDGASPPAPLQRKPSVVRPADTVNPEIKAEEARPDIQRSNAPPRALSGRQALEAAAAGGSSRAIARLGSMKQDSTKDLNASPAKPASMKRRPSQALADKDIEVKPAWAAFLAASEVVESMECYARLRKACGVPEDSFGRVAFDAVLKATTVSEMPHKTKSLVTQVTPRWDPTHPLGATPPRRSPP